jgi:hypothetical protein
MDEANSLLTVRQTLKMGRGVFAAAPIASGTCIAVCQGWLTTTDALNDDWHAMQVGPDLWLCSAGATSTIASTTRASQMRASSPARLPCTPSATLPPVNRLAGITRHRSPSRAGRCNACAAPPIAGASSAPGSNCQLLSAID